MTSKKLTAKDVEHVAKLAKLTLSKQEVKKFQDQLSAVVGYVNELSEVPTGNIEPTSQTTGLLNITRDDKLTPERTLSQKDALSGSDETHNGYFKVPYVFEGKR